MPLKQSKTKSKTTGVKTKAVAIEIKAKSPAKNQIVKEVVPEPTQQPVVPQVLPKRNVEEMIVEVLKGDTKYTRKLLKIKLMCSGIDGSTFGKAIDSLESTMKIVYVPPEVISIQDKDNAVVRLRQRVIASKRVPV